jgi:heme-degrading monooxygenase HmoA
MPIVDKSNGLLAEFAIFPVLPERQADLVRQLKAEIESQSGFVSATLLCSLDGLRVTGYTQWVDAVTYVPTPSLAGFDPPDIHLFEIFAAEPSDSNLLLAGGMDGLINFGIFKLKAPENQPRFMELFKTALEMVSGQPGLISTHAHRSLDGWRCINFGHWRSIEDFTAMDNNRPFSPLFGEMLDLADNEYQKSLHRVVETIDRS